MQHLEVSGAVRLIYESLGVKRLMYEDESNENLKYVLSRNLLNTKVTQ